MEKIEKPTLIYIQSTDGGVEKFIEKGFWERQKFLFTQYSKEFNIWYYTSDTTNFQELMPEGTRHKTSKVTSNFYGVHHILFYLFVILQSFLWRKRSIIRVWGTSLPILGIIKTISGAPLVLSFQYDWASGTRKDYKGIKPKVSGIVQKLAIEAADIVLCTMDWLARIAKEKYGKDKVIVIPNFVNTSLFKPSIKKNNIVFAGRLHWSKGVDTLILAFVEFVENNPGWDLIIIGDGEDKEKFESLRGGLKNIYFLGKIPYEEVAFQFNQAKIFVLPTKTMEGHPKALIEAMAAGCISIASNVPGNRDVLKEAGTETLLFEPADKFDLLNKLIIAKNFSPSTQLDFALRNYSSDSIIQKEISVLKSSLRNGNK